jgi:hypothetical protein
LPGNTSAAETFHLIKSPDGVVYKLTSDQLKKFASEAPKPPCKIKDCLIIQAFGKEMQVPVKSLNAYVIPPNNAQELIKAGSVPLESRWEPPPSP